MKRGAKPLGNCYVYRSIVESACESGGQHFSYALVKLNFNKMSRFLRRVQGTLRMPIRIVLRFAFLAAASFLLSGCMFGSLLGGGSSIAPAMKQMPPDMEVLLVKQGMTANAPIFIRIFKEESQLEIWKARSDGRFYHLKTYPICAWSGGLGPKVTHGDKQSPEGFYTVSAGQMNPNSQFHLAFNIGFPNAYDRANGHTGDALMVHGDCRSAGCYAMTDALIEEIYIVAREALAGGQKQFHVHAYPFRMTAANMARHRGDKWLPFWKTMKEGYDVFEATHVPPKVAVCSRQYLVNANFLDPITPDPEAACPAYQKIPLGGDGLMAGAGSQERTQIANVGQPTVTHPQTVRTSPPQPIQQPVQQQPVQRSQPVQQQQVVEHPQPQQPVVQQPKAVLSGKVQTQPAQTQHPPVQQVEAQPNEEKQVVTHGVHNVVESGKGDMIVPGSTGQ